MEVFLPFLLVIFASIFQGSFGLGMKYMAPLKWEVWWLVHVTIAMVIFPLTWAIIAVPDLFSIISSAPASAIGLGVLFGFLWGIGGILFGKSIPYIGLSLTYGIVMGLAASVGSLIPLFQMENAFSHPSVPYIIAGVMIMLVGVAITAKAGINRDKITNAEKGSSNIILGISIAVSCGILSALLNVGFANATPVAKVAESAGVITRNSSLAAWVVVLLGAYGMNAIYAIFLLFRNKSWSEFKTANAKKSFLWAIIAGLFWFAALGIYGQGSALMGEMGPIIGWPILLGLSLIISNFWGYRSGEWKDAKKPFQLLLMGLAVLIFASAILGYSNTVGI
ncbi:L-rhamnose/proton symporter RhaT [Flexithrix dorotheae]|uniref:L-rhamnose/proton symporter RhaT n=1 Tax=Flexithrix dorotheae TaxID=70993 RepID=UPI00037832ED|nr:L-rhamnose/proton symporter RhaT [Flexithrix dorotheae]